MNKPKRGRKAGAGLTAFKPGDDQRNEQVAHLGVLHSSLAVGFVQQLLIDASDAKFPLNKSSRQWPEYARVFGGQLLEHIIKRDTKFFREIADILAHPDLKDNGDWLPEDPVRKWITYHWIDLKRQGRRSVGVTEMWDYLTNNHVKEVSVNTVREAMKDLGVTRDITPGPRAKNKSSGLSK